MSYDATHQSRGIERYSEMVRCTYFAQRASDLSKVQHYTCNLTEEHNFECEYAVAKVEVK